MRIKEEFKRLGYFWLPSAPDKKVPGTLSISDGGNIELEVVGRLIAFGDRVKRIVGQIERDRFVTLDNCRCESQEDSYGIKKSFIRVNRAFIGAKYDEGEIPRFNSLVFSAEGLDEWVGISGINIDYQFEEHTSTISYQPPENIPLRLGDDMELSIAFGWTPPGFPIIKEARISQKTYFKLASQEARELHDFISVIEKITHFLCFAIDQTVSVDSMSATYNDPRRDIGGGESINIYYPSWPYSKDKPKTNRSKLFEFEEIQNDAGSIINNWIEAYKQIAPTFNLYFLAKMGMQTYLAERFMALVQGLEAYHRRTSDEKQMDEAEFKELIDNLIDQCPPQKKEWLKGKLWYGNEVSLRHRLKNLIEPFEDVIEDWQKPKGLIDKIVNTRNYLTHYDLSLESKAAKDEELWPLCLKMELLFQLHFLQLIGFSYEQIDSLLASSPPLSWKVQLL